MTRQRSKRKEKKELRTYREVGIDRGLTDITLRRYIRYMQVRWAENEEMNCACGYAQEWAERFKESREYGCSDSTGQAVLKRIDG